MELGDVCGVGGLAIEWIGMNVVCCMCVRCGYDSLARLLLQNNQLRVCKPVGNVVYLRVGYFRHWLISGSRSIRNMITGLDRDY